MLIKLALTSLRDRKGAITLSIMAMAVSIFVLLAVEHIRHQSKESFANTVSGVDLIVGGRTGNLNLLLYSVFKMGNPTNNISWQAYEKISANAKVKWAIPLSLGDSHQGYRVLGTSAQYFQYFSYGKQHRLAFEKGKKFQQTFDVVLGAQVAKKLDYKIGDNIVLAHGIAKTSFSMHDDNPFTVVGILAPTGTPVDQTLHVSLQGIDAIHDEGNAHALAETKHHHPESITAFMLGLHSKISTFTLQRSINNYAPEPLSAILPGIALSQLWEMMAIVENTLRLVSALVFISACLGVCALLITSINARKKEIALLRVIGASPLFIFLLIEVEALFITLMSIVLSMGLLIATLVFTQDYLAAQFSLHISTNIWSVNNAYLVGFLFAASVLVAMVSSVFSTGNK